MGKLQSDIVLLHKTLKHLGIQYQVNEKRSVLQMILQFQKYDDITLNRILRQNTVKVGGIMEKARQIYLETAAVQVRKNI